MISRVSGLSVLGEIDVLSVSACHQVAQAVHGLRHDWIERSPTGLFCTLGVNAYMDLANAADVQASYFSRAARTNVVLRKAFPDLYHRLAQALTDDLDLPARYAEDLALPGFHIWVGLGIPRRPTASVHFDLQYERLLTRPEYASASGTVSFTLPIELPAAGSSLRVWPEHSYPDALPRTAAMTEVDAEDVPYHLGRAVVHSGHLLHQIGATPDATAQDCRITLQGHGLVIDESLVLYW